MAFFHPLCNRPASLLPPCRAFFSTSFAASNEGKEVPFYGSPRPPPSSPNDSSWTKRLALTLQNAATALRDPTRADAVAAVGELTGGIALQRLCDAMQADQTGRIILQERPIVSKATIPYEQLLADATATMDPDRPTEEITFGQAYGAFLKEHGFDPDERDKVKYIQDPDLAYVMLRYRQCHDYWHTLTGLPPTVPGELGLKWLELFQTGLPLAALSSTVGTLGLNHHHQHVVWNIYLPWARRVGQRLKFGALMNVYYEKEWETPLDELRARLQLEPAPRNVEDSADEHIEEW